MQVTEIGPHAYRERLLETIDAGNVLGRPGGSLHHIDAHVLPDGTQASGFSVLTRPFPGH